MSSRLWLFAMSTVFLVLFDSLSLAGQMPLMNFQERMKQSDAVVVGTIEEVHQTDSAIGGQFSMAVSHWLATCHVERYLKAKIHDSDVGNKKRGEIIYIGFVQTPNTKPAPLVLVQGRKYLFFLKEAIPRDNRDAGDFYEMITPYDGAVTQEDYFWDEILAHETPQDPASSQPAEQGAVTHPLTLTIQTAKEVYEQVEPINIEASIKNSGNDTAKIYSPAYWGVSEIIVANSQGVSMKPSSVKVERASFEPFLTILPQSSAAYTFDNLTWFHCGDAWQFAGDAVLPPDTYTLYVTVTNPRCVGARILSTDLAGVLISNTITIKIKERGR